MERICIILVNYNGFMYNDKCLQSIFDSTVADRLQVVVVDNCSSDGSREELHEKWKDDARVHIIDMDENVGFARANNEGLRWAMKQGISCYLLLNNDTEIEPDTVERMWKCHKENRCIVTPKIYYADKRDILWSAGGSFSPVIKKPVQTGLNERDSDQYSQDRECAFANGCALFLDEEIIKEIGLLDEDFFLYYEDTEFSMRACKKGVRVRYCADAKVYHKVNASTKGNQHQSNVYYITRNWLIYSKKTLGIKMVLFWIYFILNRFAWSIIWLLQRKPKMIRAIFCGVRDYLVWVYDPQNYKDKFAG